MKRIIIISVLIICALSAIAQTPKKKEDIERARQAYADALQRIKDAEEEPHLDLSFHWQIHRNYPGSGIQHYDVDYFCSENVDSDEEMNYPVLPEISPYFIRVHYNWAARKYTKEYVLDADKHLLFYFFTGPDDPSGKDLDGGAYETRIYFDQEGSFSSGYSQIRHADGKITRLDELTSESSVVFDELRFLAHLIEVQSNVMNANF